MAEKQYGSGKSDSGKLKEYLCSEPKGSQINERVDGFRARKEEMHKQDGDSSKLK